MHQRLGGMQQVGCAMHSGSTFYTLDRATAQDWKRYLHQHGMAKPHRSRIDIGQRRTGIAGVTRYDPEQAQQDLVTMEDDYTEYECLRHFIHSCRSNHYVSRLPMMLNKF